MGDLAVLPLTPRDPSTIGPYQLAGRLGAGGMGVVYLGWRGDQPVAVKVMRDELASDAEFRARFAREVEVLRRIGGVCTVAVLDAAADADQPYLVTEYVNGPSLAAHVNERGPLVGSSLLALAAGLAEALQTIHAAGIVHRDLKPSNVLLTPTGPKVIDFGIAQVADATSLTATSTTLGSPGYIAPEQIRGHANTAAADVFTWAATVAFAATGRSPFGFGASDAVLFRVLHEPPDLDILDPAPGSGSAVARLRTLLEAALSKEPADRPRVDQLLAELLPNELTRRLPVDEATAVLLRQNWHVSSGGTAQLPRPPLTERFAQQPIAVLPVKAPVRRRRWLPYAAAVAAGAFAGGLSLLLVPATSDVGAATLQASQARVSPSAAATAFAPTPSAPSAKTAAPAPSTVAAAPPARKVTQPLEPAPWAATISEPDGRVNAELLGSWRNAGGFSDCDLYAPVDFGVDDDLSISFGGSSGVPDFYVEYEQATLQILPPETQSDYTDSYESEPSGTLADGTKIYPALRSNGYNDLLLAIPGQKCWVIIAADNHVAWDNLYNGLRRVQI